MINNENIIDGINVSRTPRLQGGMKMLGASVKRRALNSVSNTTPSLIPTSHKLPSKPHQEMKHTTMKCLFSKTSDAITDDSGYEDIEILGEEDRYRDVMPLMDLSFEELIDVSCSDGDDIPHDDLHDDLFQVCINELHNDLKTDFGYSDCYNGDSEDEEEDEEFVYSEEILEEDFDIDNI